jgi:hypothetical protein
MFVNVCLRIKLCFQAKNEDFKKSSVSKVFGYWLGVAYGDKLAAIFSGQFRLKTK